MIAAERTVLKMIERWLTYTQHNPNTFEWDLRDELALACLMLTSEFSDRLKEKAAIVEGMERINLKILLDVTNNAEVLFANVNTLPWELSIEILNGEFSVPVTETLYRYLCHPMSGVRFHCMKIAWIIKERLPKDVVAECMLKNVADTLGFVTPAAALARAMFENDEEFFAFAAAYQPPYEFAEQYRDRIAQLRAGAIDNTDQPFIRLENTLRQLLLGTVMCFGVGEERAVQTHLQ